MTYLCDKLLTGFFITLKKEDIVLFTIKNPFHQIILLEIKVLLLFSLYDYIKFDLDIKDYSLIFIKFSMVLNVGSMRLSLFRLPLRFVALLLLFITVILRQISTILLLPGALL